MSFHDLNLRPELIAAVEQLGYQTPTPIQLRAIPAILEGQDLIAEAQTGTGKTAAFGLPIIERLSQVPVTEPYHDIRALVLVPTRELAVQVGETLLAYGQYVGMRVISIFGGVRFDNQIRKMKRGADVLVATPGRLLDMLKQKKLSLNQLEVLVLDEADRMLDMGFIQDIRQLIELMPAERQTLLFSATLNEPVQVLADRLLKSPARIQVARRNSTNRHIRQSAYAVTNADKTDVLLYLIQAGQWRQTLVFTRTKRRADQVASELQQEGVRALPLHGDVHQRERLRALEAFRSGEADVLVATDVAARGLDIEALPQVVNYDLPNQPEAYVHRIGRTGRAGQAGWAVSLVAPEERRFLKAISTLIDKPLQVQPVPTLENGKLVEAGAQSTEKAARRQGKAKHDSATARKAKPAKTDTGVKRPARSAGRKSLFT